jgi:hypothetical protein
VFICGGALSGNILPRRPELATTTIAVYFAGGGLGLMLTGAVLPAMLDAQGPASWPQAWREMGVAAALMTLASVWAALRIEEPGAAAGSARWQLRPLAAEFASYAMFALGYIGYMTFIIAWMRGQGAATDMVVAVWCLLGLATWLAPWVWRYPAERWPGGRPLALVMAVLTLGAVLPLVSSHDAVTLASALLFGLAMFSAPSSVISFIKKALPKPAWGSAMATFTVMFAAGQMVGPVAIGWAADLTGSLGGGLAVSAGLLALGSVIALAQQELRA